MYGAFWRILPGPWWIRLLIVLVIVAIVLYSLVTWVFPWVQELTNATDVTVGG
ncbi:hypothetical protein ACUWEX_00315 [Okibacterium fritillariae]|jgi:type II secretory pathway pseudopilin PulG|uniref:DUF4175 domain-containing protein n=1 Tax=Okibacterium fritillariae TaxID=123320 RepID=A0A1T5I837_9MICO|nr:MULTISPECIES: hypothetical protein [Microbacteriaceae]SKC35374.1 hypothetical protein SAMN06309945_0059 [Okibacterium fritillariae]